MSEVTERERSKLYGKLMEECEYLVPYTFENYGTLKELTAKILLHDIEEWASGDRNLETGNELLKRSRAITD